MGSWFVIVRDLGVAAGAAVMAQDAATLQVIVAQVVQATFFVEAAGAMLKKTATKTGERGTALAEGDSDTVGRSNANEGHMRRTF